MSTPEQPAAPTLTRKQMREIRNTGANPIITDATPPAASEAPRVTEQAPPVAPLPRAAAPVAVPAPPVPDAAVDLGVSPLTRRQARQQERIRTASVPVITPEVASAHTASVAASSSPVAASSGLEYLFGSPATPEADVESPAASAWAAASTAAIAEAEAREAARQAQAREAAAREAAAREGAAREAAAREAAAREAAAREGAERDAAFALFAQTGQSTGPVPTEPEAPASDRGVVNPLLGAGLLESDPAHVDLPPSFDQLLARPTSGSLGTPNALIVSQASPAAPIVAPVSSTGEILVTGTLNLPESLGSSGHAPGTTDGKDVDAVLIDGELPAHSSPTPIAASAAISTVKTSGEMIKPPAPEKGSKLMMSLAITAGVLALALVGVLILAFVTGVF